MSLNIKNSETCMPSELARLTGETMTGAITVALRERLEREQRRRNIDIRPKAPSHRRTLCGAHGPGTVRSGARRPALR